MIDKYKNIFSDYLESSMNFSKPKNLYDPTKYILNIGGKRIRPLFLLMTCDIIRKEFEIALPAALSIEIFHNFSLVHDDIMDQSNLRRGKKTIHIKWNVNSAILSGDVMLIWAYQCLEKYESNLYKKLVSLLTRTSRQVCEGQQLDVDFYNQKQVSKDDYIKMISYKTGVLLGTSIKMGAMIGGLSKEDSEVFYQYGVQIGIAFQLQDDYLDTFGDKNKFGKKIGGDIIQNKRTLLYIFAIENSSKIDKKKLENFFSEKSKNFDQKIKLVKEIYLKYEVGEKIKIEILKYLNRALELIEKFPILMSEKTQFREFTNSLINREI